MSKKPKLIESLTPEQTLALPEFHDRWYRVGTCTDRADRPKAEAAIRAMRAAIGVTKEPVFVWCDSPATSLLALHYLKSPAFLEWARAAEFATDGVGKSLESSLRSSLWSSLWSSLRSSLGSSLWSSLWSSLRSSLGSVASELGHEWWGQHESYWIAFYLFCRDIVGVEYDAARSRQLDMWRDVAESCCWWWCYENFVVVSERPTTVSMENGRIHSATGPAVAFADGHEVHAWRGTTVPKEWIESPQSIDPQTALAHPNVEQRRAAAEILGWSKVLAALKPRVIDTDPDPMIGELIEVDLPDSPGERFLRVRCGTGRDFCLPVPPEMRSALEANAWTYGVDDLAGFKNYAVRT